MFTSVRSSEARGGGGRGCGGRGEEAVEEESVEEDAVEMVIPTQEEQAHHNDKVRRPMSPA